MKVLYLRLKFKILDPLTELKLLQQSTRKFVDRSRITSPDKEYLCRIDGRSHRLEPKTEKGYISLGMSKKMSERIS